MSVSGGATAIELRPRKPAVSSETNRLGEFFWRHSTDQADLQRVNELLCGPYDGVLVVTYKCYADDAQVCDYLYKLTYSNMKVNNYIPEKPSFGGYYGFVIVSVNCLREHDNM